MRVRIDIRIDESRLADIRGYCQRHDKTLTAFFDKALDLMFEKYNVKGEYRPKKRFWHGSIESMPLYSTRKYI
jgi:hypothetical protein